MSREIALDLSRYNTVERLGSLVEDTASLAIEASTDKDLPRVNPHFYVKRGEDYVIAPGRDKRDVSNMFAEGFPATVAALEIRKKLLIEKDFTYVWISPEGKYPESRIEVGSKKTKRNGEIEYLKCYGISTTLSREKCLELGQLLVSISKKDSPFPISPEELESLPIQVQVPKDQDPFEYLSKIIELPEANRWPSILTKEADKNKSKAVKVASSVTKAIRDNPTVVCSNPIGYGAYIETQMMHQGFGMDPEKFGCGVSNNNIRSSSAPNQEAFTMKASVIEGWHSGTCRVCQTPTWVGPCNICKPCEAKF